MQEFKWLNETMNSIRSSFKIQNLEFKIIHYNLSAASFASVNDLSKPYALW